MSEWVTRDGTILALTKEVCVIQGPLGTGKTYVGLKVVETLLKNKGFTCSLILIVCYTNALDQFLEGITKFCPRKIVRIGGRCKKQSLKQFNLNKKKHCQIAALGRSQKKAGNIRLIRLSTVSQKVIRTLSSTKPMSDKEEENIQDIWKLETEQRYALYLLWLRRFEVQLKDQLEKTVDQLKIELREKQVALDEIIAKMLEHKRITIIGMTTTGAAKHKTLLEKVGCSVVIVEEAAEVLEAHVITALNVNCQHLILIGDHQQLRPKPATFELERNFGLTVSLFERLIRNNIPHVTLKIQHRMRPEVSQIIKLIYPGLEDHPSVNEFEHIRGVSKDVFFINHNHQETRSADNFSKSNMYEAQYAVALLRSNEEDIAGFVKIDNRVCVALSRAKKGFYILGNFDLFASKSKLWRNIIDTAKKNEMIGRGLIVHCPNHPEAVKYLSTAEEFDSRPEGGCEIPCMFLLKCGHRCQLSCHGYDVRHEKYECKLPCLKSCIEEHQCPMMCYEACQCQVRVIKTLPLCGHKLEIPCCLSLESVICPEQCFKTLPCGHPCAGSCNECVSYQKHMVCYFTVDYIYRPCNHVGPKLCCLTETDLKCQNKCSEQLSCGHLCSGKCSDCVRSNKHKECLTEVEYIHQSCGHAFRLPCCKSFTNMNCTEPCKATLNCGHQWKGTCSDCLQGLVHQACNESCHLPLPCGHPCQGYCSTPCLPCKLPCPFKCRHRSCTNKQVQKSCGEPCTPCRSECMQECKHLVNLKYCSENWDNDPCSEMCTKRLKSYVPGRNGQEGKLCFHPCRGICGEICVCSQCEKVNCIKKKEASIDKPEGPILKLPLCRHNFYVSELDKYVKGHNQSDLYSLPFVYKTTTELLAL
ncbi:NFX1-type zinc finger-containing protein 1 [Bulinus truncatus]|nr:NFX1-type zinc finger-containing protein 1 [Bulinus truncatus]